MVRADKLDLLTCKRALVNLFSLAIFCLLFMYVARCCALRAKPCQSRSSSHSKDECTAYILSPTGGLHRYTRKHDVKLTLRHCLPRKFRSLKETWLNVGKLFQIWFSFMWPPRSSHEFNCFFIKTVQSLVLIVANTATVVSVDVATLTFRYSESRILGAQENISYTTG